jgi:hypothetical protein
MRTSTISHYRAAFTPPAALAGSCPGHKTSLLSIHNMQRYAGLFEPCIVDFHHFEPLPIPAVKYCTCSPAPYLQPSTGPTLPLPATPQALSTRCTESRYVQLLAAVGGWFASGLLSNTRTSSHLTHCPAAFDRLSKDRSRCEDKHAAILVLSCSGALRMEAPMTGTSGRGSFTGSKIQNWPSTRGIEQTSNPRGLLSPVSKAEEMHYAFQEDTSYDKSII